MNSFDNLAESIQYEVDQEALVSGENSNGHADEAKIKKMMLEVILLLYGEIKEKKLAKAALHLNPTTQSEKP